MSNTFTGLSNSFQDPLDDPQVLLSNLSNYEHPTTGIERSTSSNTDQFASLLQAATTATAAEAAQAGHGQNERPTNQPIESNEFSFSPDGSRRREQIDSYNSFESKNRSQSPGSDEERLAREREIWGPEEDEIETNSMLNAFQQTNYKQTPTVTASARSVGVHSAAALFRRPSKESKKYTSMLNLYRRRLRLTH